MSHYMTVVFSNTPEQVKELMAPFEELSDANSPLTVFESNDEYAFDEAQKRRGRWFNPQGRWDGHTYGANRYSAFLKDGQPGWISDRNGSKLLPTVGGKCHQALAVHCKLGFDQHLHDTAVRYWEVIVEDSPLQEGENYYSHLNDRYYKARYRSKEAFAQERAWNTPYAFVTADGVWHSPGVMGFLAIDDATIESREQHFQEWKQAIQSAIEQNLYLTVLDCHT